MCVRVQPECSLLSLIQIFEIIGFVYQYLKLLRQDSPQEWIFKELQDIGNMEFRFAEEQPQDDYAAELAGICIFKCFKFSMFANSFFFYDVDSVSESSSFLTLYREQIAKDVLQQLTIINMTFSFIH